MLKSFARAKQKPDAGLTVEMLLIPHIYLTNAPRTIYEKNIADATPNYTPVESDHVRIAEVFTYASINNVAQRFSRFTVNVNSHNIGYETVGEKGFEVVKNMLNGAEMIGATHDDVRGFIKLIHDFEGFVVLVRDRSTLDYFVLGSKDLPVTLKFTGNGGKKAGDKNVAAFDIEDESGRIFLTYPKSLSLSVH